MNAVFLYLEHERRLRRRQRRRDELRSGPHRLSGPCPQCDCRECHGDCRSMHLSCIEENVSSWRGEVSGKRTNGPVEPPSQPSKVCKDYGKPAGIRKDGIMRVAASYKDDAFEKFRRQLLRENEKLIMEAFPDLQCITATELSKQVIDSFMRTKWIAGSRIVPAFHGTRTGSIPSISSRGLLIPGAHNGVKVIHGTAHGCGIYTSSNPCMSKEYCDGYKLLLCAVLDDSMNSKTRGDASVKCCGDIMVVFKECHVAPLYVLEWNGGGEEPQGSTQSEARIDAIRKRSLAHREQMLKRREVGRQRERERRHSRERKMKQSWNIGVGESTQCPN